MANLEESGAEDQLPRIFYGLTKAKATLPGENIVTTQK
jgi:hypothetical protein